MPTRREFEQWLRTPHNEEEDGAYKVFLPFSDLGKWIPEGIDTEIIDAFGLHRLHYVRALSFLAFIGPDPERQYFLEFTHSRFDHSLVVLTIVEEIWKRNGFNEADIIHDRLAALVHDRAIPALGDATKSIDEANLDEELHWAADLPPSAKRLMKRYKISRKEVDRIIHNKGLKGQVLDIADRITYVLKDTYEITEFPMHWEPNPFQVDFDSPIRSLIRQDTKLGNIYQDVGIDHATGEIFFTNPPRLTRFLILRALLHQTLYLQPISVGRDLLAASLIRPLYSSENKALLTPLRLRQMTDNELVKKLSGHYQPSVEDYLSFYYNLVSWCPQYLKVETEEEAATKAAALQQRDNTVVIGIKQVRSFDPATSYNVKTADGKIVPFRQAHPKWAKAIESIAQSTGGLFVFFADVSQDSPINDLIKRVHAT